MTFPSDNVPIRCTVIGAAAKLGRNVVAAFAHYCVMRVRGVSLDQQRCLPAPVSEAEVLRSFRGIRNALWGQVNSLMRISGSDQE